jgi:hypothetical protein
MAPSTNSANMQIGTCAHAGSKQRLCARDRIGDLNQAPMGFISAHSRLFQSLDDHARKDEGPLDRLYPYTSGPAIDTCLLDPHPRLLHPQVEHDNTAFHERSAEGSIVDEVPYHDRFAR